MLLPIKAKNRFEAAQEIRALACVRAAHLYCYSDKERVELIVKAEQVAESLLRNFENEDDELVSEETHPWKSILMDAGYCATEFTTYPWRHFT